MAHRLVIIDDDPRLNELLTRYLTGMGYSVSSALLPDEGLKIIGVEKPDLVILDVMLPERDGFSVLKEIRLQGKLPVIMLTARGDVMDRIVGLELGADDYLPKPFEPRELVARIESVLRRSRQSLEPDETDLRRFGHLTVNLARREAFADTLQIELTTAEFDLLKTFIESDHKPLTRDDLLNALRGFDWDATNRSMDILVSRLREKLGDNPKTPQFIKTLWGTGYQWISGENR